MSVPLKPLKWYRELGERKGRVKAGAFLVEGDKAISQIINTRPQEIIEIVTDTGPLPTYQQYQVREVTESQFRYISNNRTPQGTMAVVRIPEGIYSDRLPAEVGDRILVLEDIQDPGNVGTLIRTAAAFGFSGVVLTENCADPLSPKCVQSTAGTVLSVWLRRTAAYLEVTESLKQRGYSLVATELNGGDELSVVHQQGKLLLALGSEASGLSHGLLGMADYRVSIPMDRKKAESLNVAACGAIIMYLASPT
jgi:TrmH family RNA methyltransferase